MNKTHAAIQAAALKRFPDLDLAGFNNAITGFGRLTPGTSVFDRASEAGLVKTSGRPAFDRHSLEAALSLEIANRPAFSEVLVSAQGHDGEDWDDD